MSGCYHIRVLPESLMKLRNLLHLNLAVCNRISSLGALRHLKALQHLELVNNVTSKELDVLGNLTNLKYLRIMDGRLTSLCGSEGNDIGTLTNLEHLDISHSGNLACLPESIGNLKRLHTLDLSGCHRLKSIPDSIGALRLKSLVLNGCSDELIDQASSLMHYSQTLPLFNVRTDDANVCSNLHLLEGVHVSELKIHSLENVSSLEEAKKVKLLDKKNLSELTLAWTEDAVRLLEDMDVLGELMPPRGLKIMCLKGYSSARFPGWLMGISGHLINLVSIRLWNLPTCSNLPPLGQLPNLEHLFLYKLSSITKIDREFCGGKGAFLRLLSFQVYDMKGLEEWNTTYSLEDGVEEFMFPMLDDLRISACPRLKLKPCPPTFRECHIYTRDQVIFSLEELENTTHYCSSPSRAIQLELSIGCQSIRLFHHFPALQVLSIFGPQLTSLPESIRHLTSLESLELKLCEGLSALPEWLGDLPCLKGLYISACRGIKSLPPCIQKLTKLEVNQNEELQKWCEENRTKQLSHINVQLPLDY